MSTVSDYLIEFRCASCYQSLHESAESVGKTIQCPYCTTSVEVPQATKDNLRVAEDVDPAALQQPAEVGIYAEKSLTSEEIAAESKLRATTAMSNNIGFVSPADKSCARTKRLLAVIVDGIITMVVFVANLMLGAFLANLGLIAMPTPDELSNGVTGLELPQFLGLFGLVLGLTLINWILVAKKGQTPGKMVLGIKIVDEQGYAPGFFHGVFLRQWVMGGISAVIPFVGIINYLMIFRDPPRCWHDQIASTYVINANEKL